MGRIEELHNIRDGSTTPSQSLNHAFTYLIDRYKSKIDNAGGMESLASEESHLRNFTETVSNIHPSANMRAIFWLRNSDFFTPHEMALEGIKQGVEIQLKSPVTEYGTDWAARLVAATVTLIDNSKVVRAVNIRGELDFINEHYVEELARFTHRSTRAGDDPAYRDRQRGPHLSFDEGFQAIMHAVGFLTAYKVPGFEENPDGLLENMVNQGTVSRLARFIPPKMTGKMGQYGLTFTSPTVEIENTGRINIRPDLVDFMVNFETRGLESAGNGDVLDMPGCPVARVLPDHEASGVDIGAKLLLDTMTAQKSHFERISGELQKDEQYNNWLRDYRSALYPFRAQLWTPNVKPPSA